MFIKKNVGKNIQKVTVIYDSYQIQHRERKVIMVKLAANVLYILCSYKGYS